VGFLSLYIQTICSPYWLWILLDCYSFVHLTFVHFFLWFLLRVCSYGSDFSSPDISCLMLRLIINLSLVTVGVLVGCWLVPTFCACLVLSMDACAIVCKCFVRLFLTDLVSKFLKTLLPCRL
jgi:hypothetical protein